MDIVISSRKHGKGKEKFVKRVIGTSGSMEFTWTDELRLAIKWKWVFLAIEIAREAYKAQVRIIHEGQRYVVQGEK